MSERYSIIEINPTLAKTLLARRAANRSLNEHLVARYAEDMSRGRWRCGGDPISISPSGELLNGQHRLAAVVKSGVTITALVGFDVPADSVFDSGRKRTYGDELARRGVKHASSLAAVHRLVVASERLSAGRVLPASGVVPATTTAMLEDIETRGDVGILKDAAALLKGKLRIAPTLVQSSVLGWLFWRFSKLDREEALRFFEDLDSGEGLPHDDPVLRVRNRLISDRYRPQRTKAAYLVKAWNARRSGKKISRFTWTEDEQFPEAI